MNEYPSSHIFWINVHEGLPKENIQVLAWEKQGFIYVDRIIDGKWEIASNNGGEVTFWMPLPKPPGEINELKIFYECNRHACVNCHDECRHISNVLYAKNFSTDEKGRFWENTTKEEQENGILNDAENSGSCKSSEP